MRTRRRIGRLAATTAIATLLTALGGSALAQIPSLPNVPSLPDPPPQVTNLFDQVATTAYPYTYMAAQAASPVATLGGFALRPGCGELGYAAFVASIAATALPVDVLSFTDPVFMFCSASFVEGPADAPLHAVDVAVGPTIGSAWHNVVVDFRNEVSASPQASNYLADACAVVSFAPPSADFPPPTERFQYEDAVCG